ncbi:hypothetical protein [Nonomuraea fuscirosea]|uniref:hypothetical protein n=1 Tax=Nonomuraea fuscirosea TaxID=1291556 RepID=UPI00344702BB
MFTGLGVAAWERRSCGAVSQYQVREWTPWHRHVTTCMLALAFLSVARERACRLARRRLVQEVDDGPALWAE